jgi:acylphosphatase
MPEHTDSIRLTVHFSGRVQGVGFRYTAAQVAQGFDVRGYVRNLPDGRVELVAEGRRGNLERFLEALRIEMDGYIRDIQRLEGPPTGEFSGFDIRH